MPQAAAFRFFPVWRPEPGVKGVLCRAAPALDPNFEPAALLMGIHAELKGLFD